MAKFKFTIITLLILMTYSISNAGDLITLATHKDHKVLYVFESDIRKNLTNYRYGQFMNITILTVLLSKEESRLTKESMDCLTMNPNDFKYVLNVMQINFVKQFAWVIHTSVYDKYKNLICSGEQRSFIPFDALIITNLKEIFENVNRKEKKNHGE